MGLNPPLHPASALRKGRVHLADWDGLVPRVSPRVSARRLHQNMMGSRGGQTAQTGLNPLIQFVLRGKSERTSDYNEIHQCAVSSEHQTRALFECKKRGVLWINLVRHKVPACEGGAWCLQGKNKELNWRPYITGKR